jgi:formylglycine-generating enzyme required for sulfatase activity
MGTNPSYFKGENLPVETVSWYDAVEFCNKLSEIEGLDICYSGSGEKTVCDWDANGYRLPTEAEWEYACKAGTTTDFYSGNLGYDNVSLVDTNLDKIGWYIDNENTSTREVGQKEPNDFGLYDMSGNVCEWCWDWRAAYTESDITDPRGLFSGSIRVLRGGSFGYFAWTCRSANRDADTPKKYDKHLGFRIVRNY